MNAGLLLGDVVERDVREPRLLVRVDLLAPDRRVVAECEQVPQVVGAHELRGRLEVPRQGELGRDLPAQGRVRLTLECDLERLVDARREAARHLAVDRSRAAAVAVALHDLGVRDGVHRPVAVPGGELGGVRRLRGDDDRSRRIGCVVELQLLDRVVPPRYVS